MKKDTFNKAPTLITIEKCSKLSNLALRVEWCFMFLVNS